MLLVGVGNVTRLLRCLTALGSLTAEVVSAPAPPRSTPPAR
ncbi:MAG: hypothetical protein R2713_22540 [Ilumatobacteraceae bacterium]